MKKKAVDRYDGVWTHWLTLLSRQRTCAPAPI